jgi:predicted enzyme related to lactoylglutathione lyase
MMCPENMDTGRFCWVDLAATDVESAKSFYRKLFGWTSHEQQANGGKFIRLRMSERDVGSIYQLKEAIIDHGMPSHWTPYVQVDNVKLAVQRAASLGGRVIVRPFAVSDIAQIALILDSVGALVGLWEPTQTSRRVIGDG